MAAKTGISVKGSFYLVLVMMLLLLPLPWVAAWIAAAAVHELGHYLALRCCHVPVHALSIGPEGVKMATGSLTGSQELLCALAGPAAGLFLLLCASAFPRLGLCAGLQSLFNLIPVEPLDGGRCLRCAAGLLLPAWAADMVCRGIGFVCVVGILGISGYAAFVRRLGLWPLILGAGVCYRVFREKFLANRHVKRYNSPTM